MSNMNKWIDLRMLLSEITFHRSSNKDKIEQLRANGRELLRKLSRCDCYDLCTYLESVGSERILEILQTWAKDFSFDDSDVLNFMNEGQPSPKFKVGDWTVPNPDKYTLPDLRPCQIISIQQGKYVIDNGYAVPFMDFELGNIHWTLRQVRRGDILTAIGPTSILTFILLDIIYDDGGNEQFAEAYCCIEAQHNGDKIEFLTGGPDQIDLNRNIIQPADNFHRYLLTKIMADYGYHWDARDLTLTRYIDTNQDPQ